MVDLEKPVVILSFWSTTWKQFESFPSSQNIFRVSDHMFLLWNCMKLGQENINMKMLLILAMIKKTPQHCPSGSFCCRKWIAKFTVIFTVRSVYTQVSHNSCCKELFKLHLGSGECDLHCNSLGLQRPSCTFNIRSLIWWLPDAQKRKPLRWW